MTAPNTLDNLAEAFTFVGDCWRWKGRPNGSGYGTISWRGRSRLAHRVIWEQTVGPIPEGLTLDHLCRNRLCVNPDHLEVVSNRENILRGESFSAREARQTHCWRGHPFDEQNTYPYRGGRICRKCQRLREAIRPHRGHHPRHDC